MASIESEGDAEWSPIVPLVARVDAYIKDYHQIGKPYHIATAT